MMEDNVPGFIGYHITRDGKLYSRRIERSPYKFGKWHKLRLSKKARVKVKLYKDGRGYNLSISRLVALVYVYNPNPSKFNEVMHLDNNPLNNHYRNLQWGTHSRIYISKRLKVSRKTLYNFIHRIQIRNSLE